jgi:hypothetical protein
MPCGRRRCWRSPGEPGRAAGGGDEPKGVVVAEWVLVGGGGFIGRALRSALLARGETVTVLDRRLAAAAAERLTWLTADVLTEDVELPPGRVVLLLGGDRTPVRRAALPYQDVLPLCRLAPRLAGRDVRLVSSVEAGGHPQDGTGSAAASRDPYDRPLLAGWLAEVAPLAPTPTAAYERCRWLAGLDRTGK